MTRHVGFFLLVCFVLSAIADDSNPPDVPLTRQYGGGNSKQRRELDFADIAKHLESVTSASTSIGDIKEAVLPFLNWRKKRSSGSGFDFAEKRRKPLNVRVLTTKKPPSSTPHANLRRKRSDLEQYLKDLKKVLAVPKAAGELVKKVNTLMEKARNISKTLCKNCPKGQQDQVDDYYDDYYYDDDDYFYRKRRSVQVEVPQRPKRAVKDFIDVVKTINGQVVGQAKNLLDASLDATGKAVRAAFGMVSGALNRRKRSSDLSIIDTASRMLERVKRTHPTFLQEAQAKLNGILKDSALVADKLYTSATFRLKTFLVNLLELFYSASQSFINGTLGRRRRSVDNGVVAAEEITAPERNKRFAKTMLEETMKEVKKIAHDVFEKVKVQVLTSLDQIAGVVKAYKSKLERNRRSLDSGKSLRKRAPQDEPPAKEQADNGKNSDNPTTTSQSSPETTAAEKDQATATSPITTTKNPIVKNIDDLSSLTDTVSDMLDLIANLTDMFAITRRKRDNGIEATELETPIKDFIKDMENGALKVLSKTKKLIGHTIQEVGHSIDLGLQMVSTALSRRRRSSDDEDQISIRNEMEYELFDIPEVVVRQLSEATDDLKKWFDQVVIANGKLSDVDVRELIPNVNAELDLLYGSIMDYLANPPSPQGFHEDGYDVENAYSTGLMRKKRFLTVNAIVGMLLTKVAAKATEWVYGAVKNHTVELLNNINNFEEDVTSSNRTKRETDKSLLDGIIEFPGKMLENILRKGKNSADAIIKVITGKKTVEFENEYPGRR